jgi:hypothetical protein
MAWRESAALYNTPLTKSKLQPGYDPACRDCPRLAPGRHRFAHRAVHELAAAPPATRLFDSYHCSRYNTQTKRLTAPMFEAVVRDIATFLRGAR